MSIRSKFHSDRLSRFFLKVFQSNRAGDPITNRFLLFAIESPMTLLWAENYRLSVFSVWANLPSFTLMVKINGVLCPKVSSLRAGSVRESIRSVSGERSFSNTATRGGVSKRIWHLSDQHATHSVLEYTNALHAAPLPVWMQGTHESGWNCHQ